MKLNSDCAIRVLLNSAHAGCSITMNGISENTVISADNIDFVISKLAAKTSECSAPEQRDLIVTPDKFILNCFAHAADDAMQIDFELDKHSYMSLSCLVISALDSIPFKGLMTES